MSWDWALADSSTTGSVLGGGVVLERVADLEAVHARHHDVEEHEVGPGLLLGHAEALDAVAGGGHGEALGLEGDLEQAADGGVVVDDEDDGRGNVAGWHRLIVRQRERVGHRPTLSQPF